MIRPAFGQKSTTCIIFKLLKTFSKDCYSISNSNATRGVLLQVNAIGKDCVSMSYSKVILDLSSCEVVQQHGSSRHTFS